MRKYWILLSLLISFFSCRPNNISSEKEYYHWINDKENHLVITKTVNRVILSVKYLPPEYLVYKEMKENAFDSHVHDSLLLIYNRSRTFLLTFGEERLDKEKSTPDMMYRDIGSKEEYNKRLSDLTFNIGQYIQLKTDSNTYIPVLHAFENTYGISPNRSIYLVFASNDTNSNDLLTSSKLELSFDDQIFLTGISYFSFKKQNIENIPHINFWKR